MKLKETCYIHCEGFQLEQFIHGPVCAIDFNTTQLCFIVSTNNPSSSKHGLKRIQEFLQSSKSLSAGNIVMILNQACSDEKDNEKINSFLQFVQKEKASNSINTLIELPEMKDAFSPIVHLVVLQLYTYFLSLEHSTNPGF